MSNKPPAILELQSISHSYPIQSGWLRRTTGRHEVLKNISFTVQTGEVFAIVGESGCGKSTLARLIMCLESPCSGRVYYQGQRLDTLSHRELLPLRREIQIVFQDPSAALNERFSVSQILHEPLFIHRIGSEAEKQQAIDEVLTQVGLSSDLKSRYLHELSGGQRQRIAIARSIILKPKLLLLDEPLSALDVTLQRQLIELLSKLRTQLNLTIILISHDLALVSRFSERTLVLNFGEIAELGETNALFSAPEHAYTKALLASLPTREAIID